MTGTFQFNNAFALRRSIDAFVPSVSTTGGALTIPANAFSVMGDPVNGAIFANAVCDPGEGSLTCMLGLPAVGFQAFPGFPVFAQVASTFTEMNVLPGQLGPGMGPGSLAFCPLVGNPANGVGTLPNCPGNGLTAGGGVISSMGGLAIKQAGAGPGLGWGVPNTNTSTSATFPLMGVPAGIGLGQASPPGVQGNVQYRNGGGFGGTMSVARSASVVVSQRVARNPTVFQHNKDDRTGSWAAGVPTSSQFSSAASPGPQTRLPFTTTMGGNTVNPMSPRGATGPNQAGLGVFTSILTRGPVVNPGGGPVITSTSTGFPWTTGQVLGQEDSCPIGLGAPCPNTQQQFQMFLITGSDARGPDGQGSISLVSGGILQTRAGASTVNWATLDLTMTLPEPGTAVGIGAGVLLLLGLLHRRSW